MSEKEKKSLMAELENLMDSNRHHAEKHDALIQKEPVAPKPSHTH